MREAPLTFTRMDEQLPDWLHNRLEEIRTSEYGEAERCILIVETDSNIRTFQFGSPTDTDTLRLIDMGRKTIKFGDRLG